MVTDPPRGLLSRIGGLLRTVFWALLFAFVVGFVIGTILRSRLERPVRYIGARPDPISALAAAPGDVRDAIPRIFMPCDHEEQIG
jgi:hypothetical protein